MDRDYDAAFISAAYSAQQKKAQRKNRQRKSALLDKKRTAASEFSKGWGLSVNIGQNGKRYRIICRPSDANAPAFLVRISPYKPHQAKEVRKAANKAVRKTSDAYQNGLYRKVYDFKRKVS